MPNFRLERPGAATPQAASLPEGMSFWPATNGAPAVPPQRPPQAFGGQAPQAMDARPPMPPQAFGGMQPPVGSVPRPAPPMSPQDLAGMSQLLRR